MVTIRMFSNRPDDFSWITYIDEPKITLTIRSENTFLEVDTSYVAICELILKLEQTKKEWLQKRGRKTREG